MLSLTLQPRSDVFIITTVQNQISTKSDKKGMAFGKSHVSGAFLFELLLLSDNISHIL